MALTLDQLQRIMPRLPADKAAEYLPHLNAAMEEFGIATPSRMAAFLAQLAHESGELRWWEEWDHRHYLMGCRECERQRALGMDKDSVGHAAGRQYEGRESLGNTQPGDGVRFKGRGPIELTGRANYRAASRALFPSSEAMPSTILTVLERDPDRVLEPGVGFRASSWFWVAHPSKLNNLADHIWMALDSESLATGRRLFDVCTRAINGGLNGADQRWAYYLRAREVLGKQQDKEEGRTWITR